MNKQDQSRFSKVLQKLNRTPQKPSTPYKFTQPSSENSLLNDFSVRSQKSTHFVLHPVKIETVSTLQDAIKVLFQPQQVLINRVRNRIRTEFIPTSNGMKYVLILNGTFVNISWLHSIQELESNKVLLLYYQIHELKMNRRPKIQSIVMEFPQDKSMQLFLGAVGFIHGQCHDTDVEKVYHYLC